MKSKTKDGLMYKETKIILAISVLFTLAMGLSNIFVNIILWKESKDFIIVALYNLMHYIFVPLTFIFAGWISKKKNGVWPLRIGIAFFILFFGLILYIENNIIPYIYSLGIIFGIASGFYWLAYQILSFDFTNENNRDTFNGLNGAIAGGAGSIAPLAGGYIIQKAGNTSGYTIIFACSLVLFIILIVLSLALKTKYYGDRLKIRHIWGSRHNDWTMLRRAITVWGFRDVVIGFLVTTLIFVSTGSELSTGKLTLIASIISSLAFYLQQRLIKPRHRIFSMYMGAILMLAAVLGLTWHINYTSLLIFIVLDALFSPFFLTPLSSASFNVINEYHEENLRAEYVINKEIVLNIGRIISTAIFILLLKITKQARVLNYYLLFLGCMQIFSVLLMRKMKIWKAGGSKRKKT